MSFYQKDKETFQVQLKDDKIDAVISVLQAHLAWFLNWYNLW